jgi:hypothetical protein
MDSSPQRRLVPRPCWLTTNPRWPAKHRRDLATRRVGALTRCDVRGGGDVALATIRYSPPPSAYLPTSSHVRVKPREADRGDGLQFLRVVVRKPKNRGEQWRKGWDSNPRCPCRHAGFQDRCLKPLGHPSDLGISIAYPSELLNATRTWNQFGPKQQSVDFSGHLLAPVARSSRAARRCSRRHRVASLAPGRRP